MAGLLKWSIAKSRDGSALKIKIVDAKWTIWGGGGGGGGTPEKMKSHSFSPHSHYLFIVRRQALRPPRYNRNVLIEPATLEVYGGQQQKTSGILRFPPP